MAEFRFIFRSKDYEAARLFYKDGLGLKVLESWDRGIDQRGTVFKAGDGQIEVLGMITGVPYVAPQGFEVGIEVEDSDEWYLVVQSRGLAVHGKLETKPWGHRSFSVKDPDGIKVLIYTIVKKQPD
jgi:catechol 2,3-dioxygenase-like lactoylglutathione lyase family enzyme